ncbi:hypothetical protein GCG54_00003247 [Colletotrichum gloeosporioides]|uniref:Uncharacterized protein n=1 Tax=Colletotrichum gloeosporioides TaxID=474922 RepID=A0A8H4FIQ3_COLGL|nr:uncharacterized protein GCG54_00003247 [Colletotrichum gloeosporioides]KAF3802444.1 hypothetical protein GCG54_00003247 [Colletotrichum gloeosporioides]
MKNLVDSETLVAENDWTFGQIISLALLSSSLFPILELLYKSCATGKHNQTLDTRVSKFNYLSVFAEIDRKDIGTQTSPLTIPSIPC